MIYTYIQKLFLLIFGHFICDFALQSQYMCKYKNPNNAPSEGYNFFHPEYMWKLIMFAHCFIQGGFVYLFTNNLFFSLCEIMIHFITDYLKCNKKITVIQDQTIHILCKVIWAT